MEQEKTSMSQQTMEDIHLEGPLTKESQPSSIEDHPIVTHRLLQSRLLQLNTDQMEVGEILML